MKKLSTKTIIAIVLLALISLSSFAMLSFTLADENNGATENQTAVFAAAAGYTQIDRIIENSYSGEYGGEGDKKYHILEITSGAKSSLETLCSNGVFKNYVIDGHRSITEMMADGTIDYKSMSIKDADDALETAIQKADLIYLHNDPASQFANNNDITESTKLALSSAATGDFKPFIIDGYKQTIINYNNNAKTYGSLAGSVFNTGLATYEWDGSVLSDFMGMKVTSAFYTKIKGNSIKDNWEKVQSKDGSAEYTVGKVLTIGAETTMTNKLKDHLENPDANTFVDTYDTTGVYKFGKASDTYRSGEYLYKYGYVQAESHPDFLKFETVAASADLSTMDLSKYDYILLGTDLKAEPFANDASYNALASAATARVRILFAYGLPTGGSGGTIASNPAPAYAYVLDKVATTTEEAKFKNVLVTSFSKMAIYSNAKRAKAVDDIANIIINGSFRGIKSNGNGDNSSDIYTILEIEPSYPIDTTLSKAFYTQKTYEVNDPSYPLQAGTWANNATMTFYYEKYEGDQVIFGKFNQDNFYYLRTSDVLDKTADEISYDGSTPLSMYSDQKAVEGAVKTAQTADASKLQDYYRWTLSKAKIAHAVGLPYDQVKVVHMSSIEFNSSRVALADGYDAIYIGGDISGMKAQNKWGNGGTYRMYFRDGDNNTQYAVGNGTYRSNDISDKKREELINYAKSLPVVVDTSVVNAIAGGTGVDPQSNMGKAINAIKGGSHTLYGFDSSQTCLIENSDEDYGKTYGGIVTVFSGSATPTNYKGEAVTSNHNTDEDALKSYLTTTMRPRLTLTSMPKLYVETDSSTWITRDQFQWEYEVQSTAPDDAIKAYVYVDDNANGQFENTEVRASGSGKSGTVDASAQTDWIGEDYFGPVYWKFVVVDTSTGAASSTTGISKIKRTTQDKMKVKLLQIMPETSNSRGADNANTTLYLCTECQMSRMLCHGNIIVSDNDGKYGKAQTDMMGGGFHDEVNRYNVNGTTQNILSMSGTTAGGSGGSGPSSISFNFQSNVGTTYADGTGNWEGTTIRKGQTLVISNLRPGSLVVQTPYVDGKGYSLTLSSGDTTLDIGENTRKNIIIANDGVLKIDYPDPNAQTQQTGNKTYKYIKDFLTNDDANYTYDNYGNDLGIHEHKFGIVKYDVGETRSNNPNGIELKGMDDYNTNWFLDFQNDYEVETTILTIPEYTEYITNVEALYEGKTRAQVESDKETYSQAASDYKDYYDMMVKIINGEMSSIEAADKAKLVDFIRTKLKLGASFADNTLTYISNPTEADVNAMLNAFAQSSSACDTYLTNNRDGIWNSGKINCTKEQFESEMDFYTSDDIYPTNRSYYMYFSLWKDTSESKSQEFAKYFVVWRDAKILEQYFYHEYKENELYSSVYYEDDYADSLVGKFNLKNAFTCIAIGAAENFNGQDISEEAACKALLNYANDGGNILLFHDSLVPEGITGNGTPVMTRILSETFGQGGISDTSTHKNGRSLTQKSLQYSKGHEANNWFVSQQNNNYFDYETESNNQTLHSSHDVREMIYSKNYKCNSNKANQINEGIITEYPFTIDSTLTISPTSSNGFTANIDESEMVVYYTISGGALGTKSSAYVANRNDGANNYFLYQYGTVTYTGAGHSLITGKGRDNNDERRLFINVILNSARKSTAGPSLTCHDYSSTDDVQTNSTIKEGLDANTENGLATDKDDYYTYVDSYTATPIFSFRPLASQGVSEVWIWYDVACEGSKEKNIYNPKPVVAAEGETTSGKKDVLIYHVNGEILNQFDRKTYYDSPDRWSTVGASSTLKAEHVESGKVKKISDYTGMDYKNGLYGKKRLEGYNCTEIKDADGNWTFEQDSSGNDILDNSNKKIPLVTHYSNLKLDETYFTGKNGKCTYICVMIKDGKGKTVTKNIRVELKPELLDLN